MTMIHTHAIFLDEDVLIPAYILMMEAFHNVDLPEHRSLLPSFLPIVDDTFAKSALLHDLHGIPLTLRSVEGFDDRRERASPKDVLDVVRLIQGIGRRARTPFPEDET